MSQSCRPRELLTCFVDINNWLRGTAGRDPDEVFAFLTGIEIV
jgi:hypothetical protein